MRKSFCCALGIAMAVLGWSTQSSAPAASKTASKSANGKTATGASKSSTALHRKGTGLTKSAAHKAGPVSHQASAGAGRAANSSGAGRTASARSSAAHRGKKGTATASRRPTTTWRTRQLAPTPDRYKQIQNALAAKGYLKPEAATGTWDQSSNRSATPLPGRPEPRSERQAHSYVTDCVGFGSQA